MRCYTCEALLLEIFPVGVAEIVYEYHACVRAADVSAWFLAEENRLGLRDDDDDSIAIYCRYHERANTHDLCVIVDCINFEVELGAVDVHPDSIAIFLKQITHDRATIMLDAARIRCLSRVGFGFDTPVSKLIELGKPAFIDKIVAHLRAFGERITHAVEPICGH